ncbi:cephalosporin hydroxylase family protein [Deefgea tanakiae]|uniref:Cephalosporin hydroxylase family protein n=1 Tax=Deefgea tanakiae TaxID=2865840 RepID=A0ABX8Z9G7_9NEIS|nr:cephalosporin hydroxylase family protein [Deefgea tanakiae]QZA79206.1 cephalosporin hydroxylase family protein [Deefgea tanakiae]
MNPIELFEFERDLRVTRNAMDEKFVELSKKWRQEAMGRFYVYNFTSLGRPIIQFPQDMIAIQQLIWLVKPDLIIETGVAHGGSLIQSASQLALLDMCESITLGGAFDVAKSKRKVIGIDIDIREHNRCAIESHPMSAYIEMIEGSSIAPEIVAQVHELAKGYNRIMVLMDSMHTHDHVLAELNAYAPLVSENSYCVVFDTFVEDLPVGFFKGRPWNPGNSPKSAVKKWLKSNTHFCIDEKIADVLMVTASPDGFLRRTVG